MADLYRILGVPADASEELIRQAYRTGSKRLHPDTLGSHEVMAQLNQAYAVLRDPVSRRVYDESRKPRVHRRQKRVIRPEPSPELPLAARQFSLEVLLPLDGLLNVALDWLETSIAVFMLAPLDDTRAVECRAVTAQASLSLQTTATRLARVSWPAELAETRNLYGLGLRLISDAIYGIDASDPTPDVSQFLLSQADLAFGREHLARARDTLRF
jgi:hypothetical protein